MKNIRSFLFIPLLAIALVCCDKETLTNARGCVAVKYVTGICGNAVLQIENPSYFGLGEDVDGYEHVFLATLECFTDQQPLEGKSFLVELDPSDFNDQCAVCLAMVAYSGSKKYNVRIHQQCDPIEE